MAIFRTLSQAVADLVRDGDTIAMEGFTRLIPFATGHELVRQKRRDLTLIRMAPDFLHDQLIGMGAARKLIFSWGGNPGVGSLHRFRDAVENGWPCLLEIEKHSHAAMSNAYGAGAAGLPVAIFRGYIGSDLIGKNPIIKSISCPFTREELACVPSIQPTVSIIHAQRADRECNVLVEGIVGVQKQAVLAAQRSLVTVEEVVDELKPGANSVVLPHWAVTMIALAPGGARPSYGHGYYSWDNAFYVEWDVISRDRTGFQRWMEQNVLNYSMEQFTSREATAEQQS